MKTKRLRSVWSGQRLQLAIQSHPFKTRWEQMGMCRLALPTWQRHLEVTLGSGSGRRRMAGAYLGIVCFHFWCNQSCSQELGPRWRRAACSCVMHERIEAHAHARAQLSALPRGRGATWPQSRRICLADAADSWFIFRHAPRSCVCVRLHKLDFQCFLLSLLNCDNWRTPVSLNERHWHSVTIRSAYFIFKPSRLSSPPTQKYEDNVPQLFRRIHFLLKQQGSSVKSAPCDVPVQTKIVNRDLGSLWKMSLRMINAVQLLHLHAGWKPKM